MNLEKICNSDLKLKIVSFFHNNPSTIDTSRGLSAWLNHEQKEVKKALDYLVFQEILITHRTGATVAYAYTQEKNIISCVEDFLRNK